MDDLLPEPVRAIPLDSIRQDVRFALRLMGRAPIATLVIVSSLALGIGANSAVFSVLDSLVFRPLPVADPGRLVMLTAGDLGPDRGFSNWSQPVWDEFRRQPLGLAGAFAWQRTDLAMASPAGPETVSGILASGATFDVLGVHAVAGRTFTDSDDIRGGGSHGPVAVISYRFWQRHFGGTPSAIGQSITIERVPVTIVGVTPPGFFGLDVGSSFDVALPLGLEPVLRGSASWSGRRDARWLSIVARLGPTQGRDAAIAALRRVQPLIRAATRPPRRGPRGDDYLTSPLTLTSAANGRSFARRQFRALLFVLMALVGLVLLVACANVANLLLARASTRRREIGVRRAVGASRARLARQFVTESLLYAGIGAVAGLVVARWVSRGLVAWLAASGLGGGPLALEMPLDGRAVGFTAALAAVTAIVFGVAPALAATRVSPHEAARDAGRTDRGTRRVGIGQALVVLQVGVSLALVIGAGLFARTLESLAGVSLGFDRERVLVADVRVRAGTRTPAERAALMSRARQAAASVPGVEHAAVSLLTPLGGNDSSNELAFVDARPLEPGDQTVSTNVVSPDWFAVLGMPVVSGRAFTDLDGRPGRRAAIVSRSFARRWLAGADPVGHTLQFADDGGQAPIEIVGMVGDTVGFSLREGSQPTVYVPVTSNVALPWWTVIVRTTTVPAATVARDLSAAIARADSDMTPSVATLTSQIDRSIGRERLMTALASVLGVLALTLAAVGLYGVMTYAVSRRRREIGIRIALGAAPADIAGLVLRRVAILVGLGLAAGGVASLWAGRFVASLLFAVTPRDPFTFAGAAGLLAITALLAAWLPARRAARTDPTVVLRGD